MLTWRVAGKNGRRSRGTKKKWIMQYMDALYYPAQLQLQPLRSHADARRRVAWKRGREQALEAHLLGDVHASEQGSVVQRS